MQPISVRQPPQYRWLEHEPRFDPARHLALEPPQESWTLGDFGYDAQAINAAPFPVAMTGPFLLLSPEGVEAARGVVAQLVDQARSSDRIASFVRGGVYRSRFLRDLCGCSEVTAFIGQMAGAPLLPHTMPLYQGHINLMPTEPERDVDQWHTDTVSLDYVLLLTEPETFQGGAFEYFRCTKEEAAYALSGRCPSDQMPPRIQVRLPAAGYAVLQQGNLVMHRAAKVEAGPERTTLVHSYVPTSSEWTDVSRLDDCKPVDPPEVLFTEWARHKATRSVTKLQALIKNLPHTDDRDVIVAALRDAIGDVQTAIVELADDSPGRLVYYTGDALTDATGK